jgi:hypothetical protein
MFSLPEQPDAHALFFEWDATGLVNSTDFIDAADSYSSEDYEMAAAVGPPITPDLKNP